MGFVRQLKPCLVFNLKKEKRKEKEIINSTCAVFGVQQACCCLGYAKQKASLLSFVWLQTKSCLVRFLPAGEWGGERERDHSTLPLLLNANFQTVPLLHAVIAEEFPITFSPHPLCLFFNASLRPGFLQHIRQSCKVEGGSNTIKSDSDGFQSCCFLNKATLFPSWLWYLPMITRMREKKKERFKLRHIFLSPWDPSSS